MDKYLIAIHPSGSIDKKPIKQIPQLEQLREIVGGLDRNRALFQPLQRQPVRRLLQ